MQALAKGPTMTKTPQEIAQQGERLYQERFRVDYEKKYPGKYLALDITSEEAILADTPEGALAAAEKKNPQGFFHIVKIGSPGVYRVGYTNHDNLARLF